MRAGSSAPGWTCRLVLLALGGCGGGDTDLAGGAGQRNPGGAPEVVTAIATLRPLATRIEAVGTAQARESVQVTSKSANTVSAIRFDEGSRVRRNDVLVELNATEARADVAEAEASLADTENQYRRSRELATQQALSASELDTIEATLKASRARLAAARARLEDTVIRAGFDGRTGFRRVSVGALVSPGTVITTLDDTSLIKLEFTVPEASIHLLERGLEVTAESVGLPGRTFRGVVTQIDSRVDPVTRSILVRAELPNRDGALRPGMFMSVTLSGTAAPALIVPEAAIVPEQGRAFVFVVAGGRVARREVRTGRRVPGEVEVVAGLKPDEHVVIAGTQEIQDGMQVRERIGTPPPAAEGSAPPAKEG